MYRRANVRPPCSQCGLKKPLSEHYILIAGTTRSVSGLYCYQCLFRLYSVGLIADGWEPVLLNPRDRITQEVKRASQPSGERPDWAVPVVWADSPTGQSEH